jgi:hypothetical protein
VVVVDNGSTDGSVRSIREADPHAAILETGANLGYAGGNNAGIRRAIEQGADYVCILNNDVVTAPDFLEPLAAALEADPGAAIATPLVAEAANPEDVWGLGLAVDRKTGSVTHLRQGETIAVLKAATPQEVDAASGEAMVVRREAIERVGMMDEAFYLYFEEADWCLRVRRAGYRILAVPSSVVWHKVSATLGRSWPGTDYYMTRNRLRFIARNWSGSSRCRLMARAIVHDLVNVAAYTAKPHGGKRTPHRNARLLALRDASRRKWGRMGPDVEAACRGGRR